MQDELIQLSEFLNSTWGHAAVWFAALWAILWFIRKVSKDADNDLDPEKRKALSDELLRIKDRDASSWVPDFTVVFDRFFGKKHLSWRCFYRSSLISIIAFITQLFLFDTARDYPEFDHYTFAWFLQLIVMVCLGLIFNAVIDYISLLETRTMLAMPVPIWVKIILDGMLTILLIVGWFAMIRAILLVIFMPEEYRSNLFVYYLDSLIWLFEHIFVERKSDSHFIFIVISTSFTTSIWLWLHGLSRVLIRSLSNVQKFMGWLNVKEAPLRAIGTTINLIVLTFGVLLFPVYLFY